MSEAWLAMLVPVALMTATMGMQHLEHWLLGPAQSTEQNPVPRPAPRPKTAAPSQPLPEGGQRIRRVQHDQAR